MWMLEKFNFAIHTDMFRAIGHGRWTFPLKEIKKSFGHTVFDGIVPLKHYHCHVHEAYIH